jgi:hypothetical protein
MLSFSLSSSALSCEHVPIAEEVTGDNDSIQTRKAGVKTKEVTDTIRIQCNAV